MNEREELITQLSGLSDALDRALRRTTPVVWPDVELTMPQLKTLAHLLEGPDRMGEIAAQSDISHSAATAMIDRLVQKALVTRSHDPHDRRVVVCDLSPAGRELIERFWNVREASLRTLADHMSTDELRTVVRAMTIMADLRDAPPNQGRQARLEPLSPQANTRQVNLNCPRKDS